MDNLNKLLGANVLSEDVQESLQEAFNQKLDEARKQILEETEMRIREEFSRRYEHDKATLTEAIDNMLTDVATKYETEKVTEINKLKEAREKFTVAVTESKKEYKQKIKEHIQMSRKFILNKLAEEINTYNTLKDKLNEERAVVINEAKAAKEKADKDAKARLKKMDEFVIRQVTKELREFQEDKNALVETRVKIVKESKAKLKDIQNRFIKESAKKVDKLVTENLKREMSQLHEDLERNRQNMFGRRIFESVAAEFMSSYLSEGTETKKLQKVVESKDAELVATKKKLSEATKIVEAAQRKAKLAEDNAQRNKVLGELLSTLSRDKRAVMSELLETVRTSSLRESFNKYLPTVLNEKVKTNTGKQNLTENKNTITTVTGDQRINKLNEESNEDDGELAKILKLANVK